jgi:peptide/nickel transport system substrate-binding protein
MLADAGWTDSDGDGILDKDGTPMTMKLVYYGPWPLMQAIAPVVYDNVRSLAIDVELDPLDEGAAFEQIYNNQNVEKPYDATLDGWGLYGTEPDHYRQYMIEPTGLFAFDNPEITALFDEGRRETDPDRRYAIYAEADRLLWQELPMIPLFQAVGVWGLRANVNIDAAELNGTFINGLKYPGRIYLEP